jgi:hypothetical protein
MSRLLERPRAAGALLAALVVVVVAAMLAGGALAGGDSRAERADLARAQQHAASSARKLAVTRATVIRQTADLRAAREAIDTWRRRARRAERRLRAGARKSRADRRSGRRRGAPRR